MEIGNVKCGFSTLCDSNQLAYCDTYCVGVVLIWQYEVNTYYTIKIMTCEPFHIIWYK